MQEQLISFLMVSFFENNSVQKILNYYVQVP